MGTYNDFAGRPLSVLQDVYKSESATNQRNQAIGMLMYAYEYIKSNPTQATDLYTRQCSVGVNAKDLATMAATLAFGGRNPVTGKQVISAENVPTCSPSWRPLDSTTIPANGFITPACPRRAASAVASSRSRRANSASPSSLLRWTMPAIVCAPRKRYGTSPRRWVATRTWFERTDQWRPQESSERVRFFVWMCDQLADELGRDSPSAFARCASNRPSRHLRTVWLSA